MRFRRADGDRGTVMVLYAVAMVAMLTMVAIVVDLAALRHDRAADRAAADAAALAGAARLIEVPAASTPIGVSVCREVWAYFLQNRPDATPVTTAPACATTFSANCTGAARTTTATAGPYTVTIRYPVPDGDAMMDAERLGGDTAQEVVTTVDGDPCSRIGVRVVRSRDMAFGNVVGVSTGTTDVHSVALAGFDADANLPIALLILDPSGCGALTANGGGQVRVRSIGVHPGYISVDTDATGCSGGNYGIDVQGTGSSIVADDSVSGRRGVVSVYGLRQAVCNVTDRACDPSDVAGGTLRPQPNPMRRRTGRTQVDWRYNCKMDYGALALRPCPMAATTEPHIDELVSEIGSAGLPAGFRNYRAEGYSCSIGPSDVVVVPAGNWWIDCALSVRGRLTFTGGNLVFQNGMSIGASGVVDANGANPQRELSLTCQTRVDGCTTQSSANHAFAYFRSGGIDRTAGGSIYLRNTFVYLHNGAISLTGGSGTLHWEGPGTYRTAASGPFRDLSMWSPSTNVHSMSGGSALTLDGVFFTPNALFDYSGSGSQVQTKAQFITFRLKVTGSGELVLAPEPERALQFPLTAQRLIR